MSASETLGVPETERDQDLRPWFWLN